ncbi:DUF4136 domain-containing protein [Altererythrobacter sp. RZ02]|uniref:DUF4136 domain-containing protein n=1 Tax=Pontixanthobacter rizhaonensis TaxID=2730337 RepID=A0A848QN79_9SPHN|nr:DUF4136 domain-containing protein [Pontixanthobacter rizhaonensis]NMW32339.1 DUF4136 domain-containing protein [Pontixanthobacter rizhaonensis]
MKMQNFAAAAILAATLSACVAGPRVSPVEITRFHQTATVAQLGTGTVFIESAPDDGVIAVDLSPYKSALAAELTELGYREVARDDAQYIAQVSVDRYIAQEERKQNPVSVGVGGSTGSYGSGLGLGIGLNLGGGQREMVGTDMAVRIRDAASSDVLWEGRASFAVSDNSSLSDSASNASAIADALFREFPGNNGETVEVRVAN